MFCAFDLWVGSLVSVFDSTRGIAVVFVVYSGVADGLV